MKLQADRVVEIGRSIKTPVALQFMATSHGNKVLVGVLIDPYRFVLVEDYAKSNGKKLSALIREVFYQNLSSFLDPELVQEAEEYDSALWKESVRNRVAGRKSKKI